MSNEEIELQIWEYIDGACSNADRHRIAILITEDSVWQAKFAELSSLHSAIGVGMEMEQPSMRFTKNIMDSIATVPVARATRVYINKSIIKGIAAFFIITIAAFIGYAIVSASHSSTSSSSLLSSLLSAEQLNMSGVFTDTFFNAVIGINIILGLLLLDVVLRRKCTATH